MRESDSTDHAPYPIFEVEPEWVFEPEVLGSKQKFWYWETEIGTDWLFKYSQENTGQHWAEKIAAEIATALGITRARVELAVFQGFRGSVTESFAEGGRDLFHGNQILAGQVYGYDPQVKFGHSSHTLENILLALDRTFTRPNRAQRAKARFAQYLVLDAVIGNTDRHHENWGILRRQTMGASRGILAPTFDHASSLGRELRDDTGRTSRRRLLSEARIGEYVEKARGGIFWEHMDRHGLSPLELVRRAAHMYPALFASALTRTARIQPGEIDTIIGRIPEGWMSPLARQFALELVCYNLEELRKLRT